jgi:hypothetical protein
MFRTVEGSGRFELGTARRAFITVLDELADDTANVSALLSERALAEDWNRVEEEEAWERVQRERSSW